VNSPAQASHDAELSSGGPVKINPALLGATLVGALGGLLFGFDTAVISGCQNDLVKLFSLTPGEQGFMTASAMLGATIGSLAAARPGDLYGRRDSLKVVAAFYLLCAVGCAFASSLWMIVTARFLGGLAVGATSVLGPMYLAEIAPASWRGRLVACFQVNIVLGVLIAYGSNYFLGGLELGATEWRWKLGIQAVPSLAFLVMLFFIPRSPRWLMMKGHRDEAERVLQQIGVSNVAGQITAMEESLREERAGGSAPLFVKALRRPVLLAITVAMFNQLGGINALWYYADQIFALAGFDKNASAMQSVILGVVNLVATVAGMAIIDKVGRKPLLHRRRHQPRAGDVDLHRQRASRLARVAARRHGDLPRLRPGRGHLGVHQRNFPDGGAEQGPDARQLHALVHGHAHLVGFSPRGERTRPAGCWSAVRVLRCHDARAACCGRNVLPRNQASRARRHEPANQNEMTSMHWQTFTGRVVPGHQVASGLNGNPHFPGGTLRMQAPHFLARGFDLGAYHGGTINVGIAPRTYRVVQAPLTFRAVQWHPVEPAEDFSFFDIRVVSPNGQRVAGKIYYPHPDTKPAHFQSPDVLELLLPFLPGIVTGAELTLEVPSEQMTIA
jgi:MFS family permease